MAEIDFNASIAERVMGWTVDRLSRRYRRSEDGEDWDWLPDFRFVDADYELFLREMKSLGYHLAQQTSDEGRGTRPCFWACFSGFGQRFPVSNEDARLAVLTSALLAMPGAT